MYEGYGSSPRSWETLAGLIQAVLSARFIPTVVGNTSDQRLELQTEAVHPHGRGKHFVLTVTWFPPAGSSPRSWETLQEVVLAYLVPRFIPTVVGNTLTLYA